MAPCSDLDLDLVAECCRRLLHEVNTPDAHVVAGIVEDYTIRLKVCGIVFRGQLGWLAWLVRNEALPAGWMVQVYDEGRGES